MKQHRSVQHAALRDGRTQAKCQQNWLSRISVGSFFNGKLASSVSRLLVNKLPKTETAAKPEQFKPSPEKCDLPLLLWSELTKLTFTETQKELPNIQNTAVCCPDCCRGFFPARPIPKRRFPARPTLPCAALPLIVSNHRLWMAASKPLVDFSHIGTRMFNVGFGAQVQGPAAPNPPEAPELVMLWQTPLLPSGLSYPKPETRAMRSDAPKL